MQMLQLQTEKKMVHKLRFNDLSNNKNGPNIHHDITSLFLFDFPLFENKNKEDEKKNEIRFQNNKILL